METGELFWCTGGFPVFDMASSNPLMLLSNVDVWVLGSAEGRVNRAGTPLLKGKLLRSDKS